MTPDEQARLLGRILARAETLTEDRCVSCGRPMSRPFDDRRPLWTCDVCLAAAVVTAGRSDGPA